MADKGPDLCEEYLPYNEIDGGFVVCHTELDIIGNCYKVHASTREVADRFTDWGYKRGLMGVLVLLESGVSVEAIKSRITEVLYQ